MSYIYLVPQWFFGFDIAMEVIFAIVSLIVAAYAFNIFRLSGERKCRLLSTGFLLIAISYLVKSMLNLFLLSNIGLGIRGIDFERLAALGLSGFYGYVFLFSIGVITIAYMTFKVKSWRIYSLLVIADILAIVLSTDKILAFSVFSSVILIYICIHYALEYSHNRNVRTLLLFVGFTFLFIVGIEVSALESIFKFVVSQCIELIAYILILTSLSLTIGKFPKRNFLISPPGKYDGSDYVNSKKKLKRQYRNGKNENRKFSSNHF